MAPIATALVAIGGVIAVQARQIVRMGEKEETQRRRAMWLDRSAEVWVGLIAAAAYVFSKGESKSYFTRVLDAGISGGIGFSLAPSAAQWTGNSEAIAAVLVTALGYLGLDILTSVIADRAVIKEIILRRLGGK